MVKRVGKARSVSEFVDLVTEQHVTWSHPQRIWFRGHRCATHKLVPTLHRLSVEGFAEASAFNIFWARGRGLRQFDHLDPGDQWDWYFAARHHGLPSRLLDWSQNALVALFFATEEHTPAKCCRSRNEPARVWLLEPTAMNRAFFGDSCVYIPNDRDGDDFVRHWLPSKLNPSQPQFVYESEEYSAEHAVALYPCATNERLIAQQGMFTVHGTSRAPLDLQLAAVPNTRLAYIELERRTIASIRDQLSWLGVNNFAVDADGDGLAKYLETFYISEAEARSVPTKAARRARGRRRTS